MKYIKRFFIIFIPTIFLIIHFLLPRLIIETNNPIISQFMMVNDDTFSTANHNGKYLQFESFDKVKLEAFLTYSKTDSAIGTIILLHGFRARKEQFKNLSNELSEKGLNVIALDLRAHGKSGGKYCTFGVKEKEDIIELITHLSDVENLNKNIGIWTQSLGGSIALQAMAIDERIKFGIIESTYSELNLIVKEYSRNYLGFNIDFLVDYLMKRSGKIAGYNPKLANPIDFCQHIKQPILIVHGTEDDRINIKYGKNNFEAIASSEKEFISIEHANHINIWRTGGEAYFQKTNDFIEKNTVRNRVGNDEPK